MEKVEMRDLVVLLPGITGSALQKNGKDIWALSGQAFSQAFESFGSSLQELKLKGDDPEAEDLGDGITAPRLIQHAHSVPNLAKNLGYRDIGQWIIRNFNVKPGNIREAKQQTNFFEFAYDWRRDNRANASILKRYLDQRLQQWRVDTGIKEPKVILLAHSMGGLVSRYYLEVLEGWRDCKALITFGTPYRGSVQGLDSLVNGYKGLFLELSDVLRSFPSMYQLMPMYRMLKVDGKYYKIAQAPVTLPHLDREMAADALKFHYEIRDAVAKREKDGSKDVYKILPIVGTKQPTYQSAEFVNGQLKVSHEMPPNSGDLSLSDEDGIVASSEDLSLGNLADGDGTVPYISAIPIELSNDLRDTYMPEMHGSLHNNRRVLEDLLHRLTTLQGNIGAFQGPTIISEPSAISLALEDLYLAEEPVEMHVRLSNFQSSKGVRAYVTSVDNDGVEQVFPFQEKENEWVLTIDDLKAGLYRLRVEAGGKFEPGAPHPVQDLFEVK